MSKKSSITTRGMLARSYCYFNKEYSGKKLRVRKIYAEHVKTCGGFRIAKIMDIMDIFTTTTGYPPYHKADDLM